MMAENVPNLEKEANIQSQKAQKVPNKMNPKTPTLRHIIIKCQRQGENLKSSERETTYVQGEPP